MFPVIKVAHYNDELIAHGFVTESRSSCCIDLSQFCFYQLTHAFPAIYGNVDWMNQVYFILRKSTENNKTNIKKILWSNNWLSKKEAVYPIIIQKKTTNSTDLSAWETNEQYSVVNLCWIEIFVCSKHHYQRHSHIVLYTTNTHVLHKEDRFGVSCVTTIKSPCCTKSHWCGFRLTLT